MHKCLRLFPCPRIHIFLNKQASNSSDLSRKRGMFKVEDSAKSALTNRVVFEFSTAPLVTITR